MRNFFVFDGADSRDFGVYISGQGTFNSPARVYESQPIPGRNGEIVVSANRLENVELTYPAYVYTDFRRNLRKLRSFLLSRVGYCRLEDTYQPGEYRMALFRDALEVDATARNDAGRFDVTFFCKPQRFLLSGEETQVFTAAGSIYNPTMFDARPLIRVYGTGEVGVGNGTITITEADSYTDLDCDVMEAYKGTVNKNQYVQLSNLDFPVLPPGETGIALGSGITRVEIIPRWWEV